MNLEKENLNIHIVTPARNEEIFLRSLAESMIGQKVKPYKWTIVDDGSTDNTPKIIKDLCEKYNWISGIFISDRGFDDRGSGNSKAVKLIFEKAMEDSQVDILGIFDADITFDENIIFKIINKFKKDCKLGICGGEILENIRGEWKSPAILPIDFVRGACKLYRKECYKKIGGILTRRGWDSIDNIRAAMAGWRVKRDCDLKVRHNRSVGSRDGFFRDQYKAGRDAYYIGSDFLLVLARGAVKMLKIKPLLIGGGVFLLAYFGNIILGKKQFPDSELLKFVKKRHRKILLEGFYRW